MKASLFKMLLQSMREAGQIERGECLPARVRIVGGNTVKELRGVLQLSHAEFARLLGVQVATLRRWERDRREPKGPAAALLRAIQNDPQNVLKALSVR